ncbi:MAG: hypothetical protein ACPG4T_16955 [Nannocystaceae bacterium]
MTGLPEAVENFWIEVDYSDFNTDDEARARADAAGLQTMALTSGELIFRTTFAVNNSNLSQGDAIARDTQELVLGFRAAIPRPPLLTGALPAELAARPQGWGRPAQRVEASLLAVAQRVKVPHLRLIRMYLHQIAHAQLEGLRIPASPQATLDFVVENWEAGDVGCGERYRDWLNTPRRRLC